MRVRGKAAPGETGDVVPWLHNLISQLGSFNINQKYLRRKIMERRLSLQEPRLPHVFLLRFVTCTATC